MSVQREGPLLETLTRRLAETPPDFLDEPRIGEGGSVAVPALVHDLLRMHGARAGRDVLQRFASNDARTDRNRLALVQIGCWLLADDWFLGAGCSGEAVVIHRFALGDIGRTTGGPVLSCNGSSGDLAHLFEVSSPSFRPRKAGQEQK